jgi:tetratricopeptide (TPR) repeat protein
MKLFIKTITLLSIAVIFFSGCEDFVQNIDEPINLVSEESLLSEDQIPFLIDGVTGRYHINHDALSVIAEGLSDAWEFESAVVSDATFPTFGEIDRGDIPFDNNSVDGPFTTLGQARYLADDLLSKTESIEFTDKDLEKEAYFTGYLYAALTRAQYASYFGLSKTQPGGVIDNSSLIPSSVLYDEAISLFATAITYAPSAYDVRVINSLIGRVYLYQNKFTEAKPYIEAGMTSGDEPFQSIHSLESQNAFNVQAGRSRTQFSVNRRFSEYLANDPNEANRLAIEEVSSPSELTSAAEAAGQTFWRSTLGADSKLNIISWQENYLMLAEIILEGAQSSSMDALALVNEVRNSHQISDLESIDLESLFVERDKELLHTGNRIIDQRRSSIVDWHLPSGSWQFFPITQSERNNNPNLN